MLCRIAITFRPVPKSFSVSRVNQRAMSTASNESALSPEIEELHRIACEKGAKSYIDPATGYSVFTAVFHKKRGKCCGNKCRHCPFDHVNVPPNRR